MLAELGVRGRNSRSYERGSRETQKRSIERSGSPPKKRYSPSTSPVSTPRNRNSRSPVSDPIAPRGYAQVMSPPRDPIVPRVHTPKSPRSPKRERERRKVESPMRGIERPISPIRNNQSVSPMRGVSTIGEVDRNIVPKKSVTPEYHPTPKKNGDEDYEEYRKEVEKAKATGAIQKYVIPKLRKEDIEPKVESPKDPRVERPRSPKRRN